MAKTEEAGWPQRFLPWLGPSQATLQQGAETCLCCIKCMNAYAGKSSQVDCVQKVSSWIASREKIGESMHGKRTRDCSPFQTRGARGVVERGGIPCRFTVALQCKD